MNRDMYTKGALGKFVGRLPPGRYDSHVHVRVEEPNPDALRKSFEDAGLAGGAILSVSPEDWKFSGTQPVPPEKAMDDVIAWASGSPTIYPFYWIDPLRPDACALVDMAVAKGIYGFKVIRNDAPPCDMQTMPVYRKIDSVNRPIMFHTGMFVDITPGTPKNYRRRVLRDLYETGYDLLDHVQFGTDCYTDAYNIDWMKDWMERDDAIYQELGLSEKWVDSIYRTSFERYLFGGGGERQAPTFDGLAKKIG